MGQLKEVLCNYFNLQANSATAKPLLQYFDNTLGCCWYTDSCGLFGKLDVFLFFCSRVLFFHITHFVCLTIVFPSMI